MSKITDKLLQEDFGKSFDNEVFNNWKKSINEHEQVSAIMLVLYFTGFAALLVLGGFIGIGLFFILVFIGLGITLPKASKRKRYQRQLGISNKEFGNAITNVKKRMSTDTNTEKDSDEDVREAAMKKITDKTFLKEVARNISVEGHSIETDMVCKRCGQRILSRNKFISELRKLGLRIDPQTNSITASGVYGNYGEIGNLQKLSMKLEDVTALKCNTCGNIYCLSCLVNYAPRHHSSGGKACFSCGGSINYA
ncbi:MAG: hypothetical protein LBC68_05205 [Prevotellaceae bacterium]|jgi:hypothetical protein|nr:hypothetical protein [Prevotellaceae bacterium]